MRQQILNLAQNENRLGASEYVLKAISSSSDALHAYPDSNYDLLRDAISRFVNIPKETILCGAGADDLITVAFRTFLDSGSDLLLPRNSFVRYFDNARAVGANVVEIPPIRQTTDIQFILKSIRATTKMLVLVSPGNPSGEIISRETLKTVLEELPHDLIVILDAVYAEYVTSSLYSDGLEFLLDHPRLIVLRTFSKFFALASLRVGWCAAYPRLIRKMSQFRNTYSVSNLSAVAAIAALQDVSHHDYIQRETPILRNKLVKVFNAVGIRPQQTHTNFITVKCIDELQCKAMHVELERNGIRTLYLEKYDMPDCFRISVPNSEEILIVEEAIKNLKFLIERNCVEN